MSLNSLELSKLTAIQSLNTPVASADIGRNFRCIETFYLIKDAHWNSFIHRGGKPTGILAYRV